MMDLHSPATIRHLKDKYGFRLAKGLGQNFLTNPGVLQDMVRGAEITDQDLVVEIGPGIGVLTRVLADSAAWVCAVEVDRRLEPILAETLEDRDNVEICWEDILKTDVRRLIEEGKEKMGPDGAVRIVGNLPYYITTPILMKLLEEDTGAESITVMMQKEVADRIVASPGGKDYGALSVAVQYHCETRRVAVVPKESFYPHPKVDSAILHLTMRDAKAAEVNDEKTMFACVRAGFNQRRKTLVNALSSGLGMDKEEVRICLDRAGVDGGWRAETLTIQDFAQISNEIENYQRQG